MQLSNQVQMSHFCWLSASDCISTQAALKIVSMNNWEVTARSTYRRPTLLQIGPMSWAVFVCPTPPTGLLVHRLIHWNSLSLYIDTEREISMVRMICSNRAFGGTMIWFYVIVRGSIEFGSLFVFCMIKWSDEIWFQDIYAWCTIWIDKGRSSISYRERSSFNVSDLKYTLEPWKFQELYHRRP